MDPAHDEQGVVEELSQLGLLPPDEATAGDAARFLTLLSEFDPNLAPDSTVPDRDQSIYVLTTCPQQPPVKIADIQQPRVDDSDVQIISPNNSNRGKKKRKRVVCKKKQTHKTRYSTSSSFSSSSFSSSSFSSPLTKTQVDRCEKSSFSSTANDDNLSPASVCRFHCKKCGQLRFLVVRCGLPVRECECGSTCVTVPSWTREMSGGLVGGGLGRESHACPRCLRIYSSDTQLRRHECRKQAGQPDQLKSLGVLEAPTCPICKESFIFDRMMLKHVKKQHKGHSLASK